MDGYIRVSRVAGRSGESYISPSVQREAIERWASYKNIPIAAWHQDEDWSGGTHNRPGLERAIARCLGGESDGIVSMNIDRFSRTTELGLRDLRRLEEAGARLVFVREDIDTGTVYGRMIYTILLAVAEAFLANIKASWQIAKERAVARGAYISRTPWGYARNPDGTLTPHPERARHVQQAFRLAASDSLQAAQRYLAANAPERNWNSTKVRRLLSQRSYLGETRNGDMVQTGTHEPLVSRAIWEAAQSTPAHREPRADYPLSGRIHCAECGAPMVGGRAGAGQFTYRCSGSYGPGRTCQKGPVITARIIEEYLREVIRGPLGGLHATISEPDADRLVLLERALADAESELDAFASDLTMRKALGDRYHAHLQERVRAVDRARSSYRAAARDMQASQVFALADAETDPQLFPLLLGRIFDSIHVRRGRGKVGDRVVLVPADGDRPAGIAAPKHTQ